MRTYLVIALALALGLNWAMSLNSPKQAHAQTVSVESLTDQEKLQYADLLIKQGKALREAVKEKMTTEKAMNAQGYSEATKKEVLGKKSEAIDSIAKVKIDPVTLKAKTSFTLASITPNSIEKAYTGNLTLSGDFKVAVDASLIKVMVIEKNETDQSKAVELQATLSNKSEIICKSPGFDKAKDLNMYLVSKVGDTPVTSNTLPLVVTK